MFMIQQQLDMLSDDARIIRYNDNWEPGSGSYVAVNDAASIQVVEKKLQQVASLVAQLNAATCGRG